MRALVLVLKCYLRSQGLNEVQSGGLSSYSLCNMVVAHLQEELKVRVWWEARLAWAGGRMGGCTRPRGTCAHACGPWRTHAHTLNSLSLHLSTPHPLPPLPLTPAHPLPTQAGRNIYDLSLYCSAKFISF